jgi:transposase
MSRSKYPEQFRRDAIEMVGSSDRPLRQITRELGVNHETLRSWVNTAKQQAQAGPAEDPATSDEVQRLRKQVAELQKEKEILRPAAGDAAEHPADLPTLPACESPSRPCQRRQTAPHPPTARPHEGDPQSGDGRNGE